MNPRQMLRRAPVSSQAVAAEEERYARRNKGISTWTLGPQICRNEERAKEIEDEAMCGRYVEKKITTQLYRSNI